MTIQPFPIRVNKRTVAAPQRRPGPSAYQIVLLCLGCNVLTLVVVSHLSWTLLRLVQR
jgi:hypothetical protein